MEELWEDFIMATGFERKRILSLLSLFSNEEIEQDQFNLLFQREGQTRLNERLFTAIINHEPIDMWLVLGADPAHICIQKNGELTSSLEYIIKYYTQSPKYSEYLEDFLLLGGLSYQNISPSLLGIAAFTGNIEVIEKLLFSGFDINKSDASGRTPLGYATISKRCSPDAIQFLLENGASPFNPTKTAAHVRNLISIRPCSQEEKNELQRLVEQYKI